MTSINLFTVIIFIMHITVTNAIHIHMNNNQMMVRNLILKQYLRIKCPINKRFNKYKQKLISLYYELPYYYNTLLEDDKLIIETIISLL